MSMTTSTTYFCDMRGIYFSLLKAYSLYLNVLLNEYFVILRYERFRSGRAGHGVNNGVSSVVLSNLNSHVS